MIRLGKGQLDNFTNGVIANTITLIIIIIIIMIIIVTIIIK